MFAFDEYALELVQYGIEKEFDVELFQLHPLYLFFFLMPLQHSENLEHQQLALAKRKWAIENMNNEHPAFEMMADLKWSLHHLEVIEQCGRFPQRNHILGRTTTDKEKAVIEKYNLMDLIAKE